MCFDLGEEAALCGYVAHGRDVVRIVEQRPGIPDMQWESGKFPFQVLVVRAGAPVQGEEQLQQEPGAVDGVESGREGMSVAVVLYRAVEGVGVGIEPCACLVEGFVGGEPFLAGQNLGDDSVEPVEHDPN